MARTKDVILTPEQKEQMEKEYFEALKPLESVNATRNHSQYDDVENADLKAIVGVLPCSKPVQVVRLWTIHRHLQFQRSVSVTSSVRKHWKSIRLPSSSENQRPQACLHQF